MSTRYKRIGTEKERNKHGHEEELFVMVKTGEIKVEIKKPNQNKSQFHEIEILKSTHPVFKEFRKARLAMVIEHKDSLNHIYESL